jgi:hypothetical protein
MTRIAPAAVVLLLMMPMAARAQVALVEDVNSKSAGVQSMDYVATGKQIRLGKQDTLVLSYLKSCWRETIAGGTVTVGAEQSDVQGGTVQRQKVDCDGDRLILTAQQASQSAGHGGAWSPPIKASRTGARGHAVWCGAAGRNQGWRRDLY